jgi:polysaccharide biosynthesis protein PelD
MAIISKWVNAEPRRPRFPTAELETLAILIIIPAIGRWCQPDDPLFVHSGFPWLVFASLLPALRYGFAYGFFSALVLNGYLGIAARFHVMGVMHFPLQVSAGILLSAMLAGEFIDLWTKRNDQQRIVNSYQRMRLEEFTRSYHLLKVSHDRMEHRLAAGTVSLREALMGLRRHIIHEGGRQALSEENGDFILKLVADYVAVRVAGIFRVDPTGDLLKDAVATLGRLRVDPLHDMVRQAMTQGCLVSIRDVMERKASTQNSPLVAVPLMDVNGRIHGMIVIEDMLFLSMQEENLRLLAVIGGHIGDMLSLAAVEGADADSAHFIRETRRAIQNRREHGLPAMLVRMTLPPGESGREIEMLLRRQRRGLDSVWVPTGGSRRTLLLLMPLTGQLEYEGYHKRIDEILRQQFGRISTELKLAIVSHAIEAVDSVDALLTIDEMHAVEDDPIYIACG